jgi:hypothetical protein
MWTNTSEGQKLIQEMSKDIVIEVAPEELDIFDELVMEYFQDPTPPQVQSSQKDDPLGFGIEETLIAITPAAAAVANIVINHILTEFIKITESESSEAVKGKIKALFHSGNKDQTNNPTPLTKDQLENIRKVARNQAIRHGVKADKADKIANALIGRLALL